jgi:hypothetical protein
MLRAGFALGLVGLLFVAFGVRSVADGSTRDAIESLTVAPLLLVLSFFFFRRAMHRRMR